MTEKEIIDYWKNNEKQVGLYEVPGIFGFGDHPTEPEYAKGVFYPHFGWLMSLAYYPEKHATDTDLKSDQPIVPVRKSASGWRIE